MSMPIYLDYLQFIYSLIYLFVLQNFGQRMVRIQQDFFLGIFGAKHPGFPPHFR